MKVFQVDWTLRVRWLKHFDSTKITFSFSLNRQDDAACFSKVGWYMDLHYHCLDIPVVFPIVGGCHGAAGAAFISISRFGQSSGISW